MMLFLHEGSLMRKFCFLFFFLSSSIIFGLDVQADSQQKAAQPSPYYPYDNRLAVIFPLQSYERIKPNSLYAAFESWLTYALIGGNNFNNFSGGWIGEAELQMGYNVLYTNKDHLTPFFGVGVFKDWKKEPHVTSWILVNGSYWAVNSTEKSYLPLLIYGSFGVLYDHDFNSVFSLGWHFKGMMGGPTDNKSWGWQSPVVGLDASLPFTFRMGQNRHWDLRLEPFLIYWYSSQVQRGYLGLRGNLAYRF